MRIIPSTYKKSTDLPLKIKISFEAVFEYLEKISEDKNHYLYATAVQLLEEYKAFPELRDGFEDLSLLDKYNKEIDKLLDILFPDLLQSNEIKAASIPFEFTSFKLSKRFEKIIDDAGEDYKLTLRNFDEEKIYILTCTFILAYCYDFNIDFRRPFFYDIPNLETGIIKNYRTLFNGDFFEVKPLKNAPKITEEDKNILLDNFNNIDIWREKFPPNSYEFKGFGMMNLFDVTSDESLSKLKENLLRKDDKAFNDLSESISKLFGSSSIKIGVSTYELNKDGYNFNKHKKRNSFITTVKGNSLKFNDFFCDGIISKVFKNHELLAISDVEKYGKNSNFNDFSKALLDQSINSIIIVPIKLTDELFALLELVSEKKYELNSVNAYKLKDVIPLFKIAVKRSGEEFENKLESIIQENYTSLHPTVKWKFYEEAQQYLDSLEKGGDSPYNLKSIVFENVVPLYGQSDIKGSSIARNNAIQADLIQQLDLAYSIIEKAYKKYKLPIYNDLIFRIEECLFNIKNGLSSSDENSLLDFLSKDIYPVFNHLKELDKSFKIEISSYMSLLDNDLHVIYKHRKKFDDSVNLLNDRLTQFIDKKQIEAQEMFPHYFERYKTDGVEYNMYIGQSLVKNKTYNSIYLQNLRLWQLQMMCELGQVAHGLKTTLKHPLEIASLILVHNNPLAIKFRMDEKRFDVDGAYNIRYEIIKKRIDKVHIRNTNERLTQPGKIAIVYSQASDVSDYMKHIKYLQSKNYILNTIENLDLEDLQGISGLKALRVEINYKNSDKSNISFDEIMNVLKDENLN